MTTLGGILADEAVAGDQTVYQPTYTITQGATASEVWAYEYAAGSGGLTAAAGASGVFQPTVVYHLDMMETVGATASQPATAQTATVETAGASGVFTPDYGYGIVERAGASSTLAVQATMGLSVVSAARAGGAFSINAYGTFTASAAAGGVFAYNYIAGAAIVERVGATSLMDDKRIVYAALTEKADVQDYPFPNFIYDQMVVETAGAGDPIEPDGGSTTWAINTRTNAVTQYSNWSFNSFASMGRKYIAADENGLYELNGARDITTNVVGDIQGGFFQPAAGKLAGFKGCYLAARGQGTWTLKLVAGDGRGYTYQRYSNPGLMTTKIEMGKGLRSTYFAWELIASDGQDFDLDRISFVPMVSGRRI